MAQNHDDTQSLKSEVNEGYRLMATLDIERWGRISGNEGRPSANQEVQFSPQSWLGIVHRECNRSDPLRICINGWLGDSRRTRRWHSLHDRRTIRMGCSYVADFYLLWITKFNLDIALREATGRLLFGCDSYDLDNRDVD